MLTRELVAILQAMPQEKEVVVQVKNGYDGVYDPIEVADTIIPWSCEVVLITVKVT